MHFDYVKKSSNFCPKKEKPTQQSKKSKLMNKNTITLTKILIKRKNANTFRRSWKKTLISQKKKKAKNRIKKIFY